MATAKQATVKEAASREEVKLKAPHTHGGKDLEPGAMIKVTESQKAWLEKRGII